MSKQKDTKKVCYVCALYSGVLKLGVVRYFATDAKSPDAEFVKFKETYGSNVKARYIKVNESSVDAFQKLKDLLNIKKLTKKTKVINNNEYIEQTYEISLLNNKYIHKLLGINKKITLKTLKVFVKLLRNTKFNLLTIFILMKPILCRFL